MTAITPDPPLIADFEAKIITEPLDDRYADVPLPTDDRLSDSFRPVDLRMILAGDIAQPSPTMLVRRGDGITSGLLYHGAVNGIHGDSGSAKSWVSQAAIAERLAAGETVLLLDLEDTADSIVSRLRLIGVPDHQIVDRLVYVQPTDPFGPFEINHLVELITDRNITLVVVDSLGEAFGTEGINEDRDNEVGPWLRSVARVFAAAGPAVLLIDHSTKSNGNELHPSGSKRKRAAIGGASYYVEAVTPFAKGESGRMKIVCAKDRHGTYRRGEHVAWFDMTSHPDGTATLELIAPAPTQIIDQTEIARHAVLQVIAKAEGPVNLRTLRGLVHEADVKIRNQALDDVIALLVHRGQLDEQPGPRNSRLFTIPQPNEEP